MEDESDTTHRDGGSGPAARLTHTRGAEAYRNPVRVLLTNPLRLRLSLLCRGAAARFPPPPS
jgi:ATP-dependent helicase YprA (DUF1998 family)